MTEPEENKPQETPPAITLRPPSPENMWAEIATATNYLTRLNLSLKEEPKPRLIRKSMTWFPLVGALVGTFGASVDLLMSQFGLPSLITATFAVIGMLWATRAIHEEEFASLINLYGQTLDKEQTVGWLREERSVRYDTLAIVLLIIMKIGAISGLNNNDLVFQSLIAAGCWSRALMVVAASWLRPIEGDPVADHFQQPPALRVVIAVIIGVLLTYAIFDTDAPMVLGTGLVAGLVIALFGGSQLRGYNGPLLGALQQIVELTVLGTILAVQ